MKVLDQAGKQRMDIHLVRIVAVPFDLLINPRQCLDAHNCLAHVRTPGGPRSPAQPLLRLPRSSQTSCPPKFNPVEPSWYVTSMPCGVGGAAPQGVPLSRSKYAL